MRKLNYLLIALCLLSQGLLAQDLLVKTNGDSLRGKVTISIDHRGNEYAAFRNGKEKESVKLLKVRLIEKEDGMIIRPVQVGTKYKFGKQLHFGYLSHYKVTGDGIPELFTADLLTKMDGSSLVLNGKIGFKGRVSKFLEDCYEVSYAVKNKKYTRYEVAKVVEDYNNCVQNRGLNNSDAVELRAQQISAEREAKKDLGQTLEQMLVDFASTLQNSKYVDNKEDVTAMFNDVAGKLRRNESVPNYLKTGLKEAIKNDLELTSLLNKILGEKE